MEARKVHNRHSDCDGRDSLHMNAMVRVISVVARHVVTDGSVIGAWMDGVTDVVGRATVAGVDSDDSCCCVIVHMPMPVAEVIHTLIVVSVRTVLLRHRAVVAPAVHAPPVAPEPPRVHVRRDSPTQAASRREASATHAPWRKQEKRIGDERGGHLEVAGTTHRGGKCVLINHHLWSTHPHTNESILDVNPTDR